MVVKNASVAILSQILLSSCVLSGTWPRLFNGFELWQGDLVGDIFKCYLKGHTYYDSMLFSLTNLCIGWVAVRRLEDRWVVLVQ